MHEHWHVIKDMNKLQLFLLCCLVEFIKTVLLPLTNTHLLKELTMQEFFIFLGCLFFMVCHPGVATCDLRWSAKGIFPTEVAPIYLNCLKDIMGAICYTNHPQPSYANIFHDDHHMTDAWNMHMTESIFLAGGIAWTNLCWYSTTHTTPDEWWSCRCHILLARNFTAFVMAISVRIRNAATKSCGMWSCRRRKIRRKKIQ